MNNTYNHEDTSKNVSKYTNEQTSSVDSIVKHALDAPALLAALLNGY